MGMLRWLVSLLALLCCVCWANADADDVGAGPTTAPVVDDGGDDDGGDSDGDDDGDGDEDEDEDEGKGRSVSLNQDPCFPNPCPGGAVCRATGYGTYRCDTFNIDPCDPNPCPAGTRCRRNSLGSTYTCDRTDPCSPNPCLFGQQCIRSGNGHTCRSIAPRDPCTPNPCLFGQQCIRSGNGHTCQSIVPRDPCAPNPCPFGHQCVKTGYAGHRCVAPPPPRDPCATRPCLNGGMCVPTSGGRYRCQCTVLYTGSHCETVATPQVPTPAAPCRPSPCRNGCQCVESCRHSSGYYCKSQNGYLGKNCTIPPPLVRCDPNLVTVTVDDSFVREYDMGIKDARLFIAQNPDTTPGQDCYATFNGIAHSFSLPLPFTKCGTSVDRRNALTVVVNNIWLNRLTNGGYDMPVPVICFECTYSKEYSFVTSLQPAVDQPPVLRSSGKTQVQGTIELCKSRGTCPNSCPVQFAVTRGAIYTVGELIHIIIRGGDQGVVAVRSLFLSCDGRQVSQPLVNLVAQGCPATGGNRMPTFVTYSGMGPMACVSFQVPRLRSCTTFYIHAQMESCGSTGCVTACPTGRRKRAAGEELDPDYDVEIDDVYGPIYVIEGSKGVPNEIFFPDQTLVNTTAKILDIPASPRNGLPALTPIGGRGPPIYVIVTASVIVLVFVMALVVAALHWHARGSMRDSKLSVFVK